MHARERDSESVCVSVCNLLHWPPVVCVVVCALLSNIYESCHETHYMFQ